MNDKKLMALGVARSFGVAIYVTLVTQFLNNGSKIFGEADNKTFAPIAFLMLFVFSALLTGGLILGRPIMLYLDGSKKEAVKLLFYTGASLFILLVIAFAILAIV